MDADVIKNLTDPAVLFFFLGVTPPGREATAAQNHSPLFFADESALPVGVRALTNLTIDFLNRP